MIRVTLTIDLPEWWGAEYSWANGGAAEVEELCREDLTSMIDGAVWKIEEVGSDGEQGCASDTPANAGK